MAAKSASQLSLFFSLPATVQANITDHPEELGPRDVSYHHWLGFPSNLVMLRDRPSKLIDTSTGYPTMLIRVNCGSTADQLKLYKSIVQLWRSGRKHMQGKSHCSLLETVPCAAAIQRKTLEGQNVL